MISFCHVLSVSSVFLIFFYLSSRTDRKAAIVATGLIASRNKNTAPNNFACPAKPNPADSLRCLWYAQADGLAETLTSLENLSLLPKPAQKINIEAQLNRHDPFSIAGFLHQPVRSLSTGQRQRVALTRLCFAPSSLYLWLLDEPNSGLDSAGHKAFEAMLATHQDAGGLSVLASHHLLDSRLTPRYLDLSDEI